MAHSLSELREYKVTEKSQCVRASPNTMKNQHIPNNSLLPRPIKGTDNHQLARLHQFSLVYDEVVVVL